MNEVKPLHSFLFVPALRSDLVGKAARSGAGAVVLDLEDAIPPQRKREAREALAGAIAQLQRDGMRAVVRINAHDMADAQVACTLGAWGVVVPKVNCAADLSVCASCARGEARSPRLFATIETAKGLLAAAHIAQVPEVDALMFGSGDFAIDSGMACHEDVLALPASLVVIAARAAGRLAYGLPGPITDFADLARLERMALRARALGFSGTPVIHPRQVPIIERVFGPSAEELARARAIVREFEASDGLPTAGSSGFIEWPIYRAALELLKSVEPS